MFRFISNLIRAIVPDGFVGNSTRSKQRSLLRLLALSHAQRINPALLIENLAAEHPDRYGKKLQLLQRWVTANSSMGAALAHTPGALSEEDVLAIQCGIETGTLGETLRSLVDQPDHRDDSQTTDIIGGSIGYLIAVSTMAVLVSSFLMLFIIPTFEQIFEEFGMQLPDAMGALIHFCMMFGPLIPLGFLFILGIGFLMLFEDVRRGIRRSAAGKLMPMAKIRKSSELMRLLALPVRLGQPIGPTLTAAAQFHPDHSWRKRLLKARTGAATDNDIFRQLADQKLISKRHSEHLSNIDTPSLRSWTLTKVAEQIDRDSGRRSQSLARALQHVPVILVGLFIGWVVLSVLQTLTSLITSLA